MTTNDEEVLKPLLDRLSRDRVRLVCKVLDRLPDLVEQGVFRRLRCRRGRGGQGRLRRSRGTLGSSGPLSVFGPGFLQLAPECLVFLPHRRLRLHGLIGLAHPDLQLHAQRLQLRRIFGGPRQGALSQLLHLTILLLQAGAENAQLADLAGESCLRCLQLLAAKIPGSPHVRKAHLGIVQLIAESLHLLLQPSDGIAGSAAVSLRSLDGDRRFSRRFADRLLGGSPGRIAARPVARSGGRMSGRMLERLMERPTERLRGWLLGRSLARLSARLSARLFVRRTCRRGGRLGLQSFGRLFRRRGLRSYRRRLRRFGKRRCRLLILRGRTCPRLPALLSRQHAAFLKVVAELQQLSV